jgi:hypothetical protein
MRRVARSAWLVSCAAIALVTVDRRPLAAPAFGAEIVRLSEPDGAFDTDNLISNERSYLEVVPALIAGGVSGGAYIGVGPDQNFSYIARIKPAIAYILDIRRDNLLLHLLFKALFARAPDRAAYLSLLTGRSSPRAPPGGWAAASLARLVADVEAAPRLPTGSLHTLRAAVNAAIGDYGVPLARDDLARIERFHATFIERGLELRFNSHGRPPRPHYPTLRELILATDRDGRAWHYLADERDYQFVRQLQMQDLIVPVVGDVSGPHALRAIGRTIAARGERVSAFYISNVETYLYGGAYARFAANVNLLPRGPRSVMIRSIFGGSSSTSVLEGMDEVAAGR